VIYSPATGREMKFLGPADDDVKAALASYTGEFHLLPASQTGQTCLTTCPIYSPEFFKVVVSMYNPFTGEDIFAELQMSINQKNKSAAKKPATAASGKSMEVGPGMGSLPNSVEKPDLKASGLPKLDAKSPVKHSNDSGKDKLSKETHENGSSDPVKEKTVKHAAIKPVGNDEVKLPDMSKATLEADRKIAAAVDSMSDDDLIDAVQAHLAVLADSDEGSEQLHITLEESPAHEEHEHSAPHGEGCQCPDCCSAEGAESLPEAPPAELPPELPASEPASELPAESLSMDSSEIPVLESPKEEASSELAPKPVMPPPGVHAGLVSKLRSTAAAMRAGVAVEPTELKKLMQTAAGILRENTKPAPAAAQNDLKDLVATMQRMQQAIADLSKKVNAPVTAEESSPASSEEEAVEKVMKEDESAAAEGVHFEVLQSLDDLEKEGISAASVKCHLFADGTLNPFWNVTANGEPVARIYLQDQQAPEEIKALFTSPTYGDAIASASAQLKGGLRKVLADANARYFMVKVDHTEVAQRASASAQVEADKFVQAKLADLTSTFIECLATAAIGFDRNFFKGGNPLKHAFDSVLAQHGIASQQSVRIIEAAFEEGAADYFKLLAAKANELMSMEKAAFSQLRTSILEAGVIVPLTEASTEAEEIVTAAVDSGTTLAQHLADTSNSLQAMNFGSEPLDEKAQLRSDLGFGRSK